jgi:hypothetical protein
LSFVRNTTRRRRLRGQAGRVSSQHDRLWLQKLGVSSLPTPVLACVVASCATRDASVVGSSCKLSLPAACTPSLVREGQDLSPSLLSVRYQLILAECLLKPTGQGRARMDAAAQERICLIWSEEIVDKSRPPFASHRPVRFGLRPRRVNRQGITAQACC